MSKADEISKWKKLLDEGSITNEEFERQKEVILSSKTSQTPLLNQLLIGTVGILVVPFLFFNQQNNQEISEEIISIEEMEETEPLEEISQNRELIINNIEDISSGVLQIEVEGNYAEFVADTTTTTSTTTTTTTTVPPTTTTTVPPTTTTTTSTTTTTTTTVPPTTTTTTTTVPPTTTTTTSTTTTSTTTTVPPIPENPHLENSLIWWVNDTDICFYTEVDAWPGTIKWDIYINDVLQFRNSGPAGQSTHFTHLKTSAGSSGDSLTLRVVVYDGNDLLYENTTFATTTLGPGSSYYQNITDVGNECPIGKKP